MENTFKNNINYNYIFVVDLYQLWGSLSFELILKDLHSIIKINRPKKIICIGQSVGGYMSILFGNLLNANKIFAFVP